MGVDPDRTYVDQGLTGTNRARPGLREALAACRAGDELIITKLDRLARSPRAIYEYRTPPAPSGQSVALRPCDETTAEETMANGYDGCLSPFTPPRP